jgi:hypothetical protein
MRNIYITKTETGLAELGATLLRAPGDASVTLDRLRALNPQVEDFQRLPAGTVLILPDSPEIKAGAGTLLGADHLSELANDLGSGLKAAVSRSASRVDDLKADRAGVMAALKIAAVKRLVESDPALAKQLHAAETQFKGDQKLAAERQAQLKEVQELAEAEFARLQKLLDHPVD